MSIKNKLLQIINPKEIFNQYFEEWDGNNSTLVKCPVADTRHESGKDNKPSFSINGDTGEFNCYGCGFHGTSIIGFLCDVKYGGDFNKTLAILYKQYIGEVIEDSEIDKYHTRLLSSSVLVRSLMAKRRWKRATIEKFRLGWSTATKRVTIPVFTSAGFCTSILKHDSLKSAPLVKGTRVAMLTKKNAIVGEIFPLHLNPFSPEKSTVWIVEGEPDVITAQQEGINAITLTGGVGTLTKRVDEYLSYFKNKHVIICLDNDRAGLDASKLLVNKFMHCSVASLKSIVVPEGKDISDYIAIRAGSGELLQQHANRAVFIIRPEKQGAQVVHLSKTSDAAYMNSKVITDVLVNGMNSAPYVIPKKLQFSCGTGKKCSRCPCKNSSGVADHFVGSNDRELLDWIYNNPKKQIAKIYGMKASCELSVEVIEWMNVQQINMIPALTLSNSKDSGGYCQRKGYYLGHTIEPNQAYRVVAQPISDNNSVSALLIHNYESSISSIDNFELDPLDVVKLRSLMAGSPKEILLEIAEVLSSNVTNIVGRPNLHMAVDICYHSIQNFSFNGVRLPKGSMELLLFGDTRCGKGQVAEGIAKYYDLGQTVSGESSSVMGLLGGAIKNGDAFSLIWGAIPVNNGRLVIIDEFSGLTQGDISKLSRVRSEGIAELNKGGISAKTSANTRLIWIANPNNGRQVASFTSGIVAIKNLIGAAEDIARFDLAVVVRQDEVSLDLIHEKRNKVESKFTQDVLRKIVLWAWSRKEQDVIFTQEAINYILCSSIKLAKIYSGSIPLIQGENVRFKLAKISAAIAARCFSTPDGKILKVEERHAKRAVAFIKELYSSDAMGYSQMSKIEVATSRSVDSETLDKWFSQFEEDKRRFIMENMLKAETLSINDLCDFTDHDRQRCQKHMGILVRSRACRLLGNSLYAKQPAFISYLKKNTV